MTTHLHILQLEEYDLIRFLKWWIRNPLVFKLQNKKPLVWTAKAKFIYALSFGFWPLMFLALFILKPYEIINRRVLKNKMRNKILKLKQLGLKIIAISGSYGKTSVKEYLYQILKTKYKVLRTPGNYNTLFGIAKVVEWELDENYDYFICEMGSYKIGETQELCQTYLPDYAILTGINEQHLERFGSLENEIIGESESVEYVLGKGGQAVVNLGNKHILQKYPKAIGYGQKEYAHPKEQNIDGAFTLARTLGIQKLPKILKNPIHRLSLIKRGDLTIVDDAYSSNTDGFAVAVKYLKTFEGWKIIVTPGIPELGSATYEIHKKLGEQLAGLDQVILVGRNERTRGLADGFGKDVIYIEKVTDAISKVQEKKAVVLFENDLPDNY